MLLLICWLCWPSYHPMCCWSWLHQDLFCTAHAPPVSPQYQYRTLNLSLLNFVRESTRLYKLSWDFYWYLYVLLQSYPQSLSTFHLSEWGSFECSNPTSCAALGTVLPVGQGGDPYPQHQWDHSWSPLSSADLPCMRKIWIYQNGSSKGLLRC